MRIRMICPHCVDGLHRDGSVCPYCSGTTRLRAFADTLLETGLFHSYEVFEVIDQTEYGNLDDDDKEACTAILSAGIVNLNDGSRAKTLLWSWFDSESTTRANLITLLG